MRRPAARRRRARTEAQTWRTEYLYSRAATIYGGTAEVQRNIIARRLLDLGKGVTVDRSSDDMDLLAEHAAQDDDRVVGP